MKLLIMSIEEARDYQPIDITYAIRIWNNWSDKMMKTMKNDFPLKNSPLYTTVSEYVFDDIDPRWLDEDGFSRYAVFDHGLAEKVISDFQEKGKDCESLLVHCTRGLNRSPAVAIALNEIFDLGHNNMELKKRYYKYRYHIYNVMKETAQRLRIK